LESLAFPLFLWYNLHMETVTIPKPEYDKLQTRVSELEALVSYYEGQMRKRQMDIKEKPSHIP
jgi:hypothetical protein